MTNPLKYWIDEMSSGLPSDNNVVEATTSGRFDSSYSRAAIYCPNGGGDTHVDSIAFSAEQIMWFHGEHYNAWNSGNEILAWEIQDDAGNTVVKVTNEFGVYRLYYLTAAPSTFTQIGTTYGVTWGTRNRLDLYVDITNGIIRFYVTGTARLSGTGLTPDIDNLGKAIHHSADGGGSSSWSQMFGATTSTINLRLLTVTPDTAGNYAEQAGGTVSDVNEIPYSDANFIYFTAASKRFTCKKNGLSISGLIRGVGVSYRCNSTGAGPAHTKPTIRVAGTDYDDSTSHALTSSTGVVQYMWGQNPATTADWLNAAAAGAEVGAYILA